MKKCLAFLIVCTMLFGCMPTFNVQAAGNLSDAQFFGTWSGSSWSTSPKLNYSYTVSGVKVLSRVESAVKEGNYTLAKEEFFTYMKNRSHVVMPGMATSPWQAELALRNTFTGPGSDVFLKTVDVQGDWKYVEADITERIASGQKTFMYMGAYKDNNVVEIKSKETGYAPFVHVKFTDGTDMKIEANKDTYIVGGTSDNYGTSETLLVRDSGMPYDGNNYRTYINFDLTQLPVDKEVDKGTINIYARAREEDKKVLNLFIMGDSSWSESSLTWNAIPGNIYSWYGLDSVTSWKKPSGADAEYLNVLCRLYYINHMTVEYNKDREANSAYAEKAVDILMSFLTTNKAGYNRTLETGERLRYITSAYPSLLTSPNMTADKNAEIVKFITQDMAFLTSESNWTKNTNWGFFQTNGLFQGTVFLPELTSFKTYFDLCTSRYTYMAKAQTLSDYSFSESTSGYATTVPSGLLTAKKMTINNGYAFPEELDNYLYYPMKFMMDSAHVNGGQPMFGDSGAGSMRSSILSYADILENEEFRYFGTNGEEGTYPSYTSSFYPVGKFANMRSGWDEDDTFLRIANNNLTKNGHGHPDHLSVICSAYGSILLADLGHGTYSSNDKANWLRFSTVAHNTIEIGSTAQKKGATTANTYYAHNEGLDFYEGYTLSNSSYPHYRSVFFVRPGFWIVSDSIVGQSSAKTDFKQTWHYLPNANPTVDPVTKETRTHFAEGANIRIIPADASDYDKARIDAGYYGKQYGTIEDAEYSTYVKMQRNKVNFDTLLYPIRDTEENKSATVERLETGVDTSVASGLKINFTEDGSVTDTGYYYVSHEKEPSEHKFGDFTYNGKAAYVEEDTVLLVEGSHITKNGTDLVESPMHLTDLSVKYEGNTLVIDGNNIVPAKSKTRAVKIYGENIDTVILNGEEVEFTSEDNYIYACAVKLDEVYTSTLTVTEDTFVANNATGTNYNGSSLQIKNSAPERRAYLKFDVSGIDLSALSSAKIKMYANATSLTDGKNIAVYPVDASAWNETTLTWANQPTAGATAVATASVGGSGSWYEWDVSDYLKTFDGTNPSFMLKMTTSSNNDNKVFDDSTKENAPKLVIEAPVAVIDSELTGVQKVSVTGYQGVYPNLPEKATVYYENGEEGSESIVWDEVPFETYISGESYTVKGRVLGTRVEAEAEITVLKITSTDTLEVTSYQYTKPVIPEEVTANYSDGAKKSVKANWNEAKYEDYMGSESFTVKGKVTGTEIEATANVSQISVTSLATPTGMGYINAISFPKTVSATYSDGAVKDLELDTWTYDEKDLEKAGTLTATTTVKGTSLTVTGTFTILDKIGVIEDAYTDSSTATNNGDGTTMALAKSGSYAAATRVPYLKFKLPSNVEISDVKSAKLILTVSTSNLNDSDKNIPSITVVAKKVDGEWSETTLTNANAPVAGSASSISTFTKAQVVAGNKLEFDILSIVKSASKGEEVSICLNVNETSATHFYTTECDDFNNIPYIVMSEEATGGELEIYTTKPVGQEFELEGKTYVATGESVVVNGNFSTGDMQGWTNRAGGAVTGATVAFDATLGENAITVSPGGASDTKSIGTRWTIEKGKMYYISFYVGGTKPNSENAQYNKVIHNGKDLITYGADMTSGSWKRFEKVFTAESDGVLFQTSWVSGIKLANFELVPVEFGGIRTGEITIEKNNGKVVCSTTIENPSGEESTVQLIVGIYEGDMLIKAVSKPVKLEGTSVPAQSDEITVTDTQEVKCFIWKDKTSIKPI